jgi:DNA-binding XRE family transcriptional regulator
MSWFGLGKDRTKFGKWVDKQGLTQGEVADICGVGRNTVSRLCNEKNYKPTLVTVNKIVKKLNAKGYNASTSLFG